MHAGRGGGFGDRDDAHATVLEEHEEEEDDVSAWDSCVMEGYLQLRGGRMGTKGYKQKYFRMRDTALVQYKKQSKKGKYGKGSGKILKVRDPSGF